MEPIVSVECFWARRWRRSLREEIFGFHVSFFGFASVVESVSAVSLLEDACRVLVIIEGERNNGDLVVVLVACGIIDVKADTCCCCCGWNVHSSDNRGTITNRFIVKFRSEMVYGV
mmetsp:Transcript_18425/g.25353  ORF Transcript_18425/g.25353 Transcript_18425/m.25353 type:complete len:116 (-) Transcript_18425:64-411(-)